ncbi:phosphoadenosine phosphosulfate reductase family protein [Desulfurococcaceae archaeon MEX13E-LK6-19]|nr:phosphoadenosine phosphosulfate reductase family protein [Desulfurococcaceae archaeon MEX13E-LK6-19]
MLEVIVRSKRDADAMKAVFRTFYGEWDFRVHTLHGARSLDKALEEIKDIVDDDKFYVLLLGREDEKVAMELDHILPPNIAVHIVPRAKIRNTRIEHLAHELDVARSKIRLAVCWDNDSKTYVFMLRSGDRLPGYEYNPAYDVFLGLNTCMLEEILGGKICGTPLLVRKFGGEHDVYCGKELVGKLEIPDEGFKPTGKLFKQPDGDVGTSLDKVIEVNRKSMELYERVSKSFLSKYRDWADTVIVPWSGGKDSTAALLLALDVFPKNKIKVMFADTGTEFPQTIEYVEKIAKILGIKVHRVYAGVDKGILEEGMPMPTHSNRWCTGRKIASIENGLRDLAEGNTLIITGDRDVESRTRSARPPARHGEERVMIVSPLKLWSTAHVQLYILSKGIPMNPLYYMGFYRIGCYICPALRSWEIYIMLNNKELRQSLDKLELFRRFIEYRMKLKEK